MNALPRYAESRPRGNGERLSNHFSGKQQYGTKFSSTQAYSDWLSQTAYWCDSLAARIADARSRVVIGLHVNELHSIQDEVQAFKAHCAKRLSFGGGA